MLAAFQRVKAGNIPPSIAELPALIAPAAGLAIGRAVTQQRSCIDQAGRGLASTDGTTD